MDTGCTKTGRLSLHFDSVDTETVRIIALQVHLTLKEVAGEAVRKLYGHVETKVRVCGPTAWYATVDPLPTELALVIAEKVAQAIDQRHQLEGT